MFSFPADIISVICTTIIVTSVVHTHALHSLDPQVNSILPILLDTFSLLVSSLFYST